MRFTEQYAWNIFLTLIFVGLVEFAMILLHSQARLTIADLSLTDYVLITLATWRLIRLFCYDAIMAFFREQFYDERRTRSGTRLEKPAAGMRRAVATLMGCPWCLGVWMGATVVFFYLLTPYAVYPVVFLAVSAVATFLQLLANLIGHKAEQLKRQNEGT